MNRFTIEISTIFHFQNVLHTEELVVMGRLYVTFTGFTYKSRSRSPCNTLVWFLSAKENRIINFIHNFTSNTISSFELIKEDYTNGQAKGCIPVWKQHLSLTGT